MAKVIGEEEQDSKVSRTLEVKRSNLVPTMAEAEELEALEHPMAIPSMAPPAVEGTVEVAILEALTFMGPRVKAEQFTEQNRWERIIWEVVEVEA